jgi:hypothetical protein
MRWLAVSVVLLIAGCADPARNLYAGIKQSNDAQRTPLERATQPTPDYNAYRKALETDDPK